MRAVLTILLTIISTSGVWAQNTLDKKNQISRQPITLSPNAMLSYYSGRGNLKMTLYYAMMVGDSSRNSGNMAEAERKYNEASLITVKITEKGGSFRNILLESIIDPYERLGKLYLQTNNLRKAEMYFEKAREEKDKHLVKHSVYRVSPYVGLGQVYFKKGDLPKAMYYFEEAQNLLNAATTSFYDFGIQERDIVSGLYEIAMAKGDYKSAYKYLKRSASGGKYSGSDQIPGIFQKEADFYLRTGDYEKSRHYLEKAKLYSRGIAYSVVSYKIGRTEALLKWARGDWSGANKSFALLSNSYKKNVSKNFASMTENERELFAKAFKEDFDLFNSYVVQNLNREHSDQLPAELYDNQLFGKALLLNQINKIKNEIAKSGNTELQNKVARWEKEKTTLTNLYFAKSRDQAAIERTELTIEELETDINQNSRLLQAIQNDIHWQDVKQGLKDGEAAVEIVRVRKFELEGARKYAFGDSVMYVVLFIDHHSTGPRCFVIKNGNSLEDRYLHYYHNSILARQKDTISYDQFWLPLKKYLSSYKRLFISSDGVYNQINLNTLYNSAAGRYLLDETDIVLVTNTKDIVSPTRPIVSKRAIFFGRPEYKLLASGNVSKNEHVSRSIESESLENLKEQKFDDLPQTEVEIAAIGKVLEQHQWQFQSNTGSQATEGKLKSAINPTVLHIATHGFFLQSDLPGSNSMIRSGIILSGINNAESSEEDGVLTALESTSLHLDSTDLVVLSACETGLGEIKNGEGVYGLQRGFIVAGARHLLMSLWKVDDLATRLLMEEFYKAWLSTGDLHGAFKGAQRSLRKNYPDPYDWGAFVLFGN